MAKQITVLGQKVRIEGSEVDQYFLNLADGGTFGDGVMTALHFLLSGLSRGRLVDVGANIGLHTVGIASALPHCEVLAIEANPSVAEVLRRNVRANGLTNVSVVECAAGEAEGELTFCDNHEFPAGSMLLDGAPAEFVEYLDRREASTHELISVKVRPLDAVLEEEGIPAPDVIKIDVEGHDVRVVRGARNVLQNHPVVIVEFATLALTMHAGMLPIDVLRELRRTFSHVFVVREDGRLSQIASDDDVINFLHTNATQIPVQDLLCCTAESPLLGRVLELVATEPVATPPARTPDLQHELNRIQQELNRLRHSASWRITAPLRSARSRLAAAASQKRS